MVNLADLKLARVGCREGKQYRSTHDARLTAPDGTVWRVSAITPEGNVSVWSYNAWGRLYQETSRLDQLFELESK